MSPWAARIKELLGDRPQSALAAACGIKPPSVSQWFSDGVKRTSMIGGDNLIAVAKFLNTTPEWIMTGRGQRDLSQPVELDLEILKSAIVSVKKSLRAAGLELDAFIAAPTIAFAYRERLRYPRYMDKREYGLFDAMIQDRLREELGHGEEEAGPAAGRGAGGDEKAQAAAKKARPRGRGRASSARH